MAAVVSFSSVQMTKMLTSMLFILTAHLGIQNQNDKSRLIPCEDSRVKYLNIQFSCINITLFIHL